MDSVDTQRQPIFVCGILVGIGLSYSGMFSIFCGMLIGMFIKWSTAFDTDLEFLLNRTKTWAKGISMLIKEKT